MKVITSFVFFLVTTLRGAFSDNQLTSSGPGIVRPGENLNLVCKLTGFNIATEYYAWEWIRQPPGKGLEWVAGIDPYYGSESYNPSLQSRTTIFADTSKNEISLQLSSLTAADSAVYFCARSARYSGYWFETWGKGTFVIVTSASPSAPSLFPLIPCLENSNSEEITIGCLAKDFLPDSVTLSWQKPPNNESLETAKIMRFPSVLKSGVFTTSSEATVPSSNWTLFQPFFCKAEHSSETKFARVVRQTPVVHQEPMIAVRVPPLEDFRGPYLNATLVCLANHLHTDKTNIMWLEDGKGITSGVTTTAPTREGHGGYSIISTLIVTKRDWFADKTFSCQVKNEKFNDIRNVSKPLVCEDCGGSTVPVHVETIAPSFADIYTTKSVKLTCRTSNIPFGQDLSKLNVTWIRERDGRRQDTQIGQPKEQENKELVFVDATTIICEEEWNSGDNFLCKVSLPLLAITKTASLKKENGGSHSPPSVYVLSPPSEELAAREMATLTCLLKGFYPNNFFVNWLRNDEPVGDSEYFVSTPIQESKSPERYFTYSTLMVTEQDWNSGTLYTCVVGHEALTYETTQKTIDKNTGKPTLVNVSLVLSDITSGCH